MIHGVKKNVLPERILHTPCSKCKPRLISRVALQFTPAFSYLFG